MDANSPVAGVMMMKRTIAHVRAGQIAVVAVILGMIAVPMVFVKADDAPPRTLADFVAPQGSTIPDGSIDGTLGSEWSDASSTVAGIDPRSGTIMMTFRAKHDGTYIYMGINFTMPTGANNPWVAINLADANCMSSNVDGALFGDDNFAANGYTDMADYSGPTDDLSNGGVQDGVGAINVVSLTVYIELKKPLNSGDTNGNDIAWVVGNTYTMMLVFDTDGGGSGPSSGGGSLGHRGGGATTPTARTIQLLPAVSEFSFGSLIAISSGIAMGVVILSTTYRKSRNKKR